MLVVIGIFTNGEVSNTCTNVPQNHRGIRRNAVCRCSLTGMFDWARSDLTGMFDWARSDLTGMFDWARSNKSAMVLLSW